MHRKESLWLSKAAIGQAIRAKSTFELEHRIILADGTVGWALSRAIPLLNTQSDIVEWVGVASDITQRKHAEEAINRQEKRTLIAVEAAEMGTWEWNLAAKQVYWNEQHFNRPGYAATARTDESGRPPVSYTPA